MLPSPSSISMFHIRSCKLSDAHEGAFAIMVLPSQPVAQHRRLPKLKPVVDKHSSDALRVDDRHHHLYGLGCKQSAGRHKGIPAPEGTVSGACSRSFQPLSSSRSRIVNRARSSGTSSAWKIQG
jgi:hypothetical protein